MWTLNGKKKRVDVRSPSRMLWKLRGDADRSSEECLCYIDLVVGLIFNIIKLIVDIAF